MKNVDAVKNKILKVILDKEIRNPSYVLLNSAYDKFNQYNEHMVTSYSSDSISDYMAVISRFIDIELDLVFKLKDEIDCVQARLMVEADKLKESVDKIKRIEKSMISLLVPVTDEYQVLIDQLSVYEPVDKFKLFMSELNRTVNIPDKMKVSDLNSFLMKHQNNMTIFDQVVNFESQNANVKEGCLAEFFINIDNIKVAECELYESLREGDKHYNQDFFGLIKEFGLAQKCWCDAFRNNFTSKFQTTINSADVLLACSISLDRNHTRY